MRKFFSGNLNYSSWSIRPLLALRKSGLGTEEEIIPLDLPESADRLRQISPTGRVPVLVWDDLVIWDSLAILEFIAERTPAGTVWPVDPGRRALARSVCCEMHSGFQTLRTLCPMDIRSRLPAPGPTPALQADINRVIGIWTELRRTHGRNTEEPGPFLFGRWSGADAFFTPVVTRFRTYGITLQGEAESYASAILEDPVFRRLEAEATGEPWWIRYDASGRSSGYVTPPAGV